MNATTTSQQSSPNVRKGKGPGSWIQQHKIASVLIFVVVLLACGAGYYSMTSVSGIEMNASSWNIRSFSFRRDPFTNYQFTGVRHQGIASAPLWSSSDQASYSRIDTSIQKHISGQPVVENRWDLVTINDSVLSDGPAEPLYRLLNSRDGSLSLHWSNWSSKFPKLAAILWPAAKGLTELGLYQFTPDLLAITCEELDEAAFKQRVSKFMMQSIIEHCGRDDISSDEKKAAATLGLRYGDDPVLQSYL